MHPAIAASWGPGQLRRHCAQGQGLGGAGGGLYATGPYLGSYDLTALEESVKMRSLLLVVVVASASIAVALEGNSVRKLPTDPEINYTAVRREEGRGGEMEGDQQTLTLAPSSRHLAQVRTSQWIRSYIGQTLIPMLYN